MKKFSASIVTLVLAALFIWQPAGDPAQADTAQINGKTLYAYGESRDPGKVEVLVAALDNPNRHLRRISARALGKIGDSRAVTPLIKVLLSSKEDSAVRTVAAWALGAINAGEAVEPLSQCLGSDDRRVRLQAGKSLHKIAAHYIQMANANLNGQL